MLGVLFIRLFAFMRYIKEYLKMAYLKNLKMVSLKRIVLLIFIPLVSCAAFGQTSSLQLKQPSTSTIQASQPVYYFQGKGHPRATLLLQGDTIPIYSTGVFAAALPLQVGINTITLNYQHASEKLVKEFYIHYSPTSKPQATSGFAIESIQFFPNGDLWLRPGELLQVEVKATPGQQVTWMGDVPLLEVDTGETGVAGIYRGTYKLSEKDQMQQMPLTFILSDGKQKTQKTSTQKVTVLHPQLLQMGRIKSPNTPLYYSLGTDRLGGATMGTIDSGVLFEITGRVHQLYRVRLTDLREAYIRSDHIQPLSGGHWRPQNLTSSWNLTTEGNMDVLRIGLDLKIPYVSVAQDNPSRISIDLFGVQANTSWIAQKTDLLAIGKAWYEQVEKDVLRVHIDLKTAQVWGYSVGYEGKFLVIKIKPQPSELDLSHLTIGIDPGHGGSNVGAVGPTGIREKAINLAISLQLKRLLEAKGAKVVMTRQTDTSVPNAQRLSMMRNANPDMVLSIHCNSAVNPMAQGTSTFYKQAVFKDLSFSIFQSLCQLPLAPYGSIGQFNFVMNSATEFPSSLIEVGFLSNPYDESLLIDAAFQGKVAQHIVLGMESYLEKLKSSKASNAVGSPL
jgi:N-acetylmuramoyl-L-alanine amidase